MKIDIRTDQRNYPIHIERGILRKAGELMPEGGRVFIVTESGVPDVWKDMLREELPGAPMYTFSEGEASKNLVTFEDILTWLAGEHASRKDIIAALGGGVTGDLAGFAAASYMRGIQYVNIPTTMLSQLDSSIGGKTAVDLGGLKNIVGAFWQPSAVIIDPDTLGTLPERQMRSGLAESVKAGLIRDPELFAIFERAAAGSTDAQGQTILPDEVIDEIIRRSLIVKKDIVEADEREGGQRKLLNFGHTIGHAYETYYQGEYAHGECVAMGMMKILGNEDIRNRLKRVLEGLGLPTECSADPERILELVLSDKKASGSKIDVALVDEIGDGHIESWTMEDIRRVLL